MAAEYLDTRWVFISYRHSVTHKQNSIFSNITMGTSYVAEINTVNSELKSTLEGT